MVRSFTISAKWPKSGTRFSDPIEATFCNLKISIGDENVTSYSAQSGQAEDHLELPSYYLAEWIAENWWPLLWEPRKDDEDPTTDDDFMSRHSLQAAQNGFVLPNITFTPTGDSILVTARSRRAEYAEARFVHSAEGSVSRRALEGELNKFVESTLDQLKGIGATPLHSAWIQVRKTDKDEITFCQLMGALGLSPYESHPSIEKALDFASSILSSSQLLDLCLTSTAEDVVLGAGVSAYIHSSLSEAPQIDLKPFEKLQTPSDGATLPPWRLGYQSARRLREYFGVSEINVDGADAIFDKLNVSQAINYRVSASSNESPVIGVTEKSKSNGKLALVPSKRSSRRFSGARATYFLWSSKESRLITSAVTRDQQASRAFAAELLVPQAYIRREAPGNRLKREQVVQIAERADVAPEMVKLQAQNAGLTVSA